MIIKIKGSHQIEIKPGYIVKNETPKELIGSPYCHALRRKRSDMSNKVAIISKLLQKVEAETVIEYFGGIGVVAGLVDKYINPKQHTLLDLDESCVSILKKNFPNKEIILKDSLTHKPDIVYDLSLLDFNKLTYLNKPEPLLDTAMESPTIILTDSAIAKFHLNRKQYEKSLNTDMVTFDDYVYVMDDYIKKKYNRYVTHCYYFSHASYFLIQQYPIDFDIDIRKFDEKDNVEITDQRSLL